MPESLDWPWLASGKVVEEGECREELMETGGMIREELRETPLWSGTNKDRDVSPELLARPFARLLAPLTSLTPSLVGK